MYEGGANVRVHPPLPPLRRDTARRPAAARARPALAHLHAEPMPPARAGAQPRYSPRAARDRAHARPHHHRQIDPLSAGQRQWPHRGAQRRSLLPGHRSHHPALPGFLDSATFRHPKPLLRWHQPPANRHLQARERGRAGAAPRDHRSGFEKGEVRRLRHRGQPGADRFRPANCQAPQPGAIAAAGAFRRGPHHPLQCPAHRGQPRQPAIAALPTAERSDLVGDFAQPAPRY